MRRAFAIAALLLCSAPAVAQITYQNNGRPWIDTGRAYYDEESDPFSDSRQLTQVWKVYPQSKQVLYWTRMDFTHRHIAHLKKKWSGWGKVLDPRLT